MIELPLITPDFLQALIQNFTIIATLILLYSFIPASLTGRSRLFYALSVGAVFGLAAAVSIPALWMNEGDNLIGFNIVLIPLAGSIGGPISSAVVAATLILGGTVSESTFMPTDLLTIMNGVLLGSLFNYGRITWDWFPKKAEVRVILLGIGVAIIVAFSFVTATYLQPPPPGGAPQPQGLDPVISIIPFLAGTSLVTIIIGSIIIFIDRKKQAEQELRDHKAHLEELVKVRTGELELANSLQNATIESTADGIVVVDRGGKLRSYNWKAAQILNLPDRPPGDRLAYHDDPAATQETFAFIIAPFLEDAPEFLSLIGSLPVSAEQIVSTGLRFKNGRIYEIFIHPHRIGEAPLGRVYSFHDITDQKLAEEAITAANNKLILLSSLTRHDIFNQITALSAYLELVRMGKENAAAQEQIDAMTKSLEVIRLQLEFTRDYEVMGIKKPSWNSVEQAFCSSARSFAGKGIVCGCTTGSLEIYTDQMIGQVFYNLIDNSLRHGERVSEIRLHAREDGAGLLLIYEDNGTGVVPEEKEKIFIKGFGKHTGLGMFLIKEILSITGITISETGTYGEGVRFEIRVPHGKYRFSS